MKHQGPPIMPTFDVEHRTITAFEIDDTYLFQQYFDEDEFFSRLEQYYNADKYLFEVPAAERKDIEQILDDYFYDLSYTDGIDSYVVVAEQDDDLTPILRNAVIQTTRHRYRIFLMKDETSVEQAIEHGARRPENTSINTDALTWNIDGS